MTKGCYLDFDGVLHSSEVYLSRDHGIQMRARGRSLFEWVSILEELLEPHPELAIILSTSWVGEWGEEFARDVLPVGLQRRVIGATYTAENLRYFDAWPRGRQVTSDVQIRKLERWFALDDDASGWPVSAKGRVIKTEGATGIGALDVQSEIWRVLNAL